MARPFPFALKISAINLDEVLKNTALDKNTLRKEIKKTLLRRGEQAAKRARQDLRSRASRSDSVNHALADRLEAATFEEKGGSVIGVRVGVFTSDRELLRIARLIEGLRAKGTGRRKGPATIKPKPPNKSLVIPIKEEFKGFKRGVSIKEAQDRGWTTFQIPGPRETDEEVGFGRTLRERTIFGKMSREEQPEPLFVRVPSMKYTPKPYLLPQSKKLARAILDDLSKFLT